MGIGMTRTRSVGLLLALGVLSACAERDVILPGERFDLYGTPAAEAAGYANRSAPISLPAAQSNASWTQRAGGPSHVPGHPALGGALSLAFATDIGTGDGRRARITADPVVAGSTIYTMDANSTVSAVSNGGQVLWQADVRRGLDGARDASGGGLAYADGALYVVTGFGQLVVLDASSGGQRWAQDLDAMGTGAPTIAGDLVYVSSRDSRGWAIERSSGRIRWTLPGTPSPTGFGGGSAPAVSGGMAIFPFSSGEIVAAFAEGGRQRWSTPVVGRRDGLASAGVSEIAGDPVVIGDTVYAANVSGRIEALSLADGDLKWAANEGAVSPLWPAGGSLFFVNDIGQLVRLAASNGEVIWRQQLPAQPERRRGLFGGSRTFASIGHYGPVLAGGRLIVVSSDGAMRQFSPENGSLLATSTLPNGAATNPVVAGGTLYVVTKGGQLLAFR